MSTSLAFNKYFDQLKEKIALTGRVLNSVEENNLYNNLLLMKDNKVITLVNNYKNTKNNYELETIVDTFYKTEATISGFGVLFRNSQKVVNVPGKVIKFLLSERKVAKNNMLKHVNDEDQTYYENYDIIQKIFKLLGNSWYGSFAESNFHFFNPFLGPSVTYTGQHVIISAIMAFEGLLADNIKFFNFSEILHFFYNIKKEKLDENYSLGYYDDITLEKFIKRFENNCIFKLTEFHYKTLTDIYNNTEPMLLEKYYYKNNLDEFLDKEEITELFSYLVCDNYHNPEKPPEDILPCLKDFNTLIDYYIGYPYQIQNKEEKVRSMVRKAILLTDTDSTFIYLDTVIKKMKNKLNLDGGSNQNVSLVNIFTFVLTHFIAKVFYILTTNMGVVEIDKKLVAMKNEFLFKRVMLTKNKKSYASKVLMKEGEIYLKPKFDVKGIKIKTISTPKPARILFTKVLEDEILNSEKIIPKNLFNRFVEFEKEIHNSLNNLETQYLKPAKFGILERYAAPFQQQVVRGTLLWNALYPTEYIDKLSQVYLLKFKNNSYEELEALLGTELFNKIEKEYFSIKPIKTKTDGKLVDNDYSDVVESEDNANDDEDDDNVKEKKEPKTLKDYGLTCIAIPRNKTHLPKEFLSLIDKTTIVNDVISNGNILLESIGYTVIKSNKYISYTNILEF
jgi:hypothetical protein